MRLVDENEACASQFRLDDERGSPLSWHLIALARWRAKIT
jgi:hypothetical protein